MRRLTYFVATTLDGFIASPDSDHSMFLEGEDHGAWALSRMPETVPTAYRRLVPGLAERENVRFDTVLMGRGTYERGLRDGAASPYAHLRQYVLSRSLEKAADPAVEVVSRDAVDFVRELKREDGMEIWLCGGGKLAGALREEIDELVLKVNPVAIGSGVPLFDAEYSAWPFTTIGGRVYDSGVAVMSYARLD
ncbi:dihydrofolate reductase [Streptomyces sp. AJS327]|uniref:dihydrofolate reductase family protein n=1 Tax=Streptomyces sp. AJS327 TaxID=2545265 RepID=UPI0015DF6CA4|nr:dihydrofolate reductase family protein [Streptomyces sp. AJS327]MBA0050255.1 dihydrofolate reductase [Streptomyces sp. AJS327]